MRCASVTTVNERRIRIRIIMDIIQEPRGQPRGRDRELGLAMMIIIGELMEGPWVGVEDTIGMDIDDLALVFGFLHDIPASECDHVRAYMSVFHCISCMCNSIPVDT